MPATVKTEKETVEEEQEVLLFSYQLCSFLLLEVFFTLSK